MSVESMNPAGQEEEKGGMDALLAEIEVRDYSGTEKKLDSVSESDAEKEKNAKALEQIRSLVQKFNELVRYDYANDDIWSGKQSYYALTDNKEGYTKVHREDYDCWLARADIYEEALKQYHDAGGTGDLKDVFPYGSTRESVLSFEKNAAGGPERQFEGTKKHLKGEGYKKENDFMWRKSPISNSPNEFVGKLVENTIDTAKYYKGYGGSEEYKRKGINNWFERPAIGFGLAALDSGDVEVAARSFALSSALAIESPELVEQIRASLKKLDVDKQKSFVNTFQTEKTRIKSQIDSLVAA